MNRSAAWFAFASLVVLAIAAASVVAVALYAGDEGLAESDGAGGFRAFIPKLQRALDRRDLAFLGQRMQTTHIVCSAEDLRSLGGPACATVGQEFEGFPVGRWRSEGGIVPALGVLSQLGSVFGTQLPEASDDFGDGSVRVHAIVLSEGKSHAIITALITRPANFDGSDPLRIVIGTAWSFTDGRWRFTSSLSAYVLGEEFLIPCREATEFLGGVWERYPNPDATGPGPARCPVQ